MFKLDDFDLDLDVDDDILNGAFNVNNPSTDSSFINKSTECVLRSKPQKKNEEEASCSSKAKIEEKNVCNKVLPQRKFPGPAGILPDIPLKDINNVSLPLDQSKTEEAEIKNESVIYSQTSASIFEEPPYLKLLSDFDMNNANSPLNKYTIDWVKKKAVNKVVHSIKIPFLAVVIHHIDHSTPDPVVILRDPTGEMFGTLHREVWNDMHGKFQPGSALALRQVGVLTAGARRQVFLTITSKNILSVYTAYTDSDDIQVETVNIHRMSSTELIKSINNWQAQVQSSSSNTPKKNSSNSLFFTINQDSPLKRKLNQSTPIKKDISKPACDFDISIDDINFDDFSEDNSSDQNKNSTGIKFQPKFDIEVRQKKPILRKTESDLVPNVFKPKDKKVIISSQVLTQEENQMVEEVLDGIDLGEFDL